MTIDNGQLTIVVSLRDEFNIAARHVPNTTRAVNGTTQCSGDDSSPSHVSTITRAVERHYLTAACRGGNLPPATFRVQPVWLNGITYRYVIPTEMKWSGGIFPSSENNQHKVKLAT